MNWAIESLPETRQTTHGWDAAGLQSCCCCRGGTLRKATNKKGADVRRSIILYLRDVQWGCRNTMFVPNMQNVKKRALGKSKVKVPFDCHQCDCLSHNNTIIIIISQAE
jgi:hypothetical protein